MTLPGPPTPWWIPRWVASRNGEAHVQFQRLPRTLCGRRAQRKEYPVTSFCHLCGAEVDRWAALPRPEKGSTSW